MTRLSRSFIALPCFAALACTESPESTNSDSPDVSGGASSAAPAIPLTGTFAFANEGGSHLLSLDTSATPDAFDAAVCGKDRFHVRYVGMQSEPSQPGDRHVARDFAKLTGQLFQLDGGTAPPNETCFLTNAAMVTHIDNPASTSSKDPCVANHVADLARVAGRAVLTCWRLGAIDQGTHYLAAHFAPADTSALAGLALVQDSVRFFYPLNGRYSAPGEDVWRVDDGGIFDPETIRLLFVARLPQGYAAALLWAGGEGELAQLVATDSTPHARMVLSSYRYWAPR
jgi:hypothetical protein